MKQILLTGGAGGLGRAAAVYLADRGCTVFSCDIREQKEYPGIVPVELDLRNPAGIEAALKKVSELTDSLEAIVHMAGVYMMDSFAEMEEDRLSAILDVNLMGVYRVNKAFLPLVIKGKGRIIITTSEMAWQKPLPFTGVYSLSKTALECYADSLRLELMLLGVPVITMRPGAFSTELLSESSREMERLRASTRLYKNNLGRIARVMGGRFKKAKEPERLAKVYWQAITSPRPRFRYTVNASLLLRLYGAMPRRLQALALRLLLKDSAD